LADRQSVVSVPQSRYNRALWPPSLIGWGTRVGDDPWLVWPPWARPRGPQIPRSTERGCLAACRV